MEPTEGSVEQAQQRIMEKWGVAPKTETPEEPKEEVTEEATGEVVEEVTTQTEEPPEAEEAVEGEAEVTEAPDDEATVSTLSDLAEAIEVEQDFLYKIKIPYTDPSGKRGDFTLSEIKDSFQDLSRVKEERNRFEKDRQTFEKERQEVLGRLNERLTEADQVLNGLEAQLDSELTSPEMEELRKNDPAEWTAKRQEIEDRKHQLREQRDGLKSQANKTLEEQQAEFQAKLGQQVQVEAQKTLEAIPEWKDPERAKADIQKVVTYLKGMEASDEEISQIADHRFWVIALKAMRFDEGQQKVDVAKKKVKKLPIRIKPSAAAAKKDSEEEAVKKRRDRLRKTGSIDDAAAVFRDRLFKR